MNKNTLYIIMIAGLITIVLLVMFAYAVNKQGIPNTYTANSSIDDDDNTDIEDNIVPYKVSVLTDVYKPVTSVYPGLPMCFTANVEDSQSYSLTITTDNGTIITLADGIIRHGQEYTFNIGDTVYWACYGEDGGGFATNSNITISTQKNGIVIGSQAISIIYLDNVFNSQIYRFEFVNINK